jgi:hypothetical protein
MTAEMTTTTAQTSFPRYNIAALTTSFTPTPACATGFIPAPTASNAEDIVEDMAFAYLSDCGSSRQCLPGTSTWAPYAFYSPGWICPVGWTTATVVSQNMTNSAVPTEVLGRLLYPETAAFCCPR